MSREIKFRAWDGLDMYHVGELGWTVGGLRWYGPGVGSGCVEEDGHTIMQFTGLKDKNGVEIYEGDIIQSKIHHPEKYAVEFIEGGFCATHPLLVGYPIDINHFKTNQTAVIGNIYENPNLLTKEAGA